MTVGLLPLFIGLLFVANVLTALACYALRDFSRSRLDEICRIHKNAKRFGVILKQYERALLAAEIVDALVTITFIVTAVVWLGIPSLSGGSQSAWLIFAVKWLAVGAGLLFGVVLLPWSIARVAGEAFLFRAWPVVSGTVVVLRPVVSLAQLIDKILHRIGGRDEPSNGDEATLAEEIRTVVDEGQRGGILESGARTMIHRVMELNEEDVAAVMTPRTDMFCIAAAATLEQARQQLLEAGHTRVPVIGKSTDDIIGILYAKDLLKHMQTVEDAPKLAGVVREPFYVPETTGLDTLLETMKRKHVHLAIVLDEYGGVAGLVTLEDILEEIVGEIEDEYDTAEAEPIQRIEPGVAEVEARVHIDDLNEQFEYGIPEDSDYDTIGGFVSAFLGRIPESGESFTWKHLRFNVLEADKRKLVKLRIEVDDTLAAVSADEG